MSLWQYTRTTATEKYITGGLNTLRLYQDIRGNLSEEYWEVYAFEASALIQPYVDDFIRYLNHQAPEPEAPLPRSGSSGHLAHYADHIYAPLNRVM